MSVSQTEVGYQNRLGTTYQVVYPDFPSYSTLPTGIELIQKVNHHDIMLLKYNVSTFTALKGLQTGVPINVTWKNGNNIRGEFHGYVSSFKRKKAGQLLQDVEVIAVAASYPLKQTGSTVWTNKTISEVVEGIAKKLGLKSVVSKTTTRYTQLAQHGMTYFQFLVELSDKAGCAFSIKGTTIYFKTFDDLIDKNMGTIPYLYFDSPHSAPFHASLERTLDRFEPMLGDLVENKDYASRRTKSITGIDPITGKVYASKASPDKSNNLRQKTSQVLFDEYANTQVVNSLSSAIAVSKAQAEMVRFTQPAKFYSQGDARISPNSLVEVDGIDTESDGYWLVREVTHSWGITGKYTCEGEVVTDGRGLNRDGNKRYAQNGNIPALNLTDFGDGASLSKPKAPQLSSSSTQYSQSNVGYTRNPSKWV